MGVTVQATDLPGVLLCELHFLRDPRGFFVETYHGRTYAEAGIPGPFVQDNFSHSRQGTLRGMHYQLRHPQAKLVSVLRGAVYDVAVDIRRGSPTFGRWVGSILSRDNGRQLYIPGGFAHGFCVLSEEADVVYKCSDFYDPADDRGVRWNDPRIGIDWPVREPLLSAKDRGLPGLDDDGADLPDWPG